MRRILPTLLCAGCLFTGLPVVASAQTNPGFTFTYGNGPSGKQQLKYVLNYGTPGHKNDRYRLKLGSQKVAISGITITYPENYSGSFDPKQIEVRTGSSNQFFGRKLGNVVPLSELNLDKEARVITIVPQEIIPAGVNTEVVLTNVRNPSSGGMYYFNCQISSPGDIPLMRYIGTWILAFYRS